MASSTSSRSRSRGPHLVHRYKGYYILLFSIILIGLLVTCALQFWPSLLTGLDGDPDSLSLVIRSESPVQEIVIARDGVLPTISDQQCTFHTCFDVYHCGYNDDNRISVYVYPPAKYLDENGISIPLPISREFGEIVQAIMDSIYYESDADKACLLLPPLDLLNQNNLRLQETAQILATLPRWNDGTNHLLFNMLPGSSPEFNTSIDIRRGKAIVAGGGFSTWSYRRTYDVAIPVYNPLAADIKLPTKSYIEARPWLLVSSQTGLHMEYRTEMQAVADKHPDFLLLDKCSEPKYNFSQRCVGKEVFTYPDILQDASFCLVVRGNRLGVTALYDVMMAGCIPVLVADSFLLPFSEVLDWKRAALVVKEDDLSLVRDIVNQVTPEKVLDMRKQVTFLWESYLSSIHAITLTTLQVLNDRVFPYAAKKYEEWNDQPNKAAIQSPLFLPLIPPKTAGFTAVILTFDRLESLFRIIQQVALAPSLSKVLVVWNNQQKAPPPASAWPKISKPLKVVQTRSNKLSNRFYPYDEIETEAILALDDDILMLTTDELEFAYEVWRQFPDRLVGFPSRLHLWDNGTQRWRYESEWTSEISMVLTGAAFYHKYYSFLYTNAMPGNIKSWVDEHMNCEDIAMNFLIANVTGQAPVKVTPRQKFKCPECQNMTMLSADLTHMVERSECLNKFAEIYGTMPLKTVEFRADPVLYKDRYPANLKWFNNVGSL